MSRGNVFKLSGNMALNSNNPYPPTDINDIKNSLKLLKSKQNQKKPNEDNLNYEYHDMPYNNNPRSEQIRRSSQNTNQNYNQGYKNPPNYGYDMEILSKNHIPKQSTQKQITRDKPTYQNSRDKVTQKKPSSLYEENYYSNSKPNRIPPRSSVQTQEKYDNSYNNFAAKDYNKNKKQQESNFGRGVSQIQKPIKQANRQNKVDIIEYNPRDFIQCSQGCGRKFNPDSISKHEAICKKVFQKKRKQFNAQAHRIVQKDQIKLMKRGEIVEKKIQEKKAQEKMPKWKAESLNFRAIIKQGKPNLTQQDKILIQKSKEASQQGQVKCPYCGRTFNETAGPRHITFCESQQKKLGNKKKK